MPDTPEAIDELTRLARHREIELVLLLTRPDGKGEARMASLVAEGVDWQMLYDFSWRHRLLSLLHNRLIHLGIERFDVPRDILDAMAQHAQKVSQHNLLLTGELLRLLRAAGKKGIALLPFKGPVLAHTLYGNLSVRPFGDLDILCHRADVAAVRTILIDSGFKPRLDLSTQDLETFLRYEHDLTFVHLATGIIIELHWRFFSRYVAFQLGGEAFWKGLRPVTMAGVQVLSMPPEEHLLLLAVHGSKHLWGILGWVLDVARLIEVERGIDWARLRQLAAATGSSRTMHVAMILACRLFGTELPAALRDDLERDRTAQQLAEEVIGPLMADSQPEIPRMQEHRFYLRSRERVSDRFYYGWWWLFTPNYRDQQFIPLPSALSPLHYVIRPIRLLLNLFRGNGEG